MRVRKNIDLLLILSIMVLVFLLLCSLPVTAEDDDDDDGEPISQETILLSQGTSVIDRGGGNKGNLTLNKDYLVWTNFTTQSTVQYMNRESGKITTTTESLKALPLRMHGNTLLIDNVIYDMSSGSREKIAFDYAMGSTAVSGDRMVVSLDVNYPSTPMNYDLYLYKISSKDLTPLVENPYYQSQPALWDNDLVWMDGRHGMHEVYKMDMNSKDVRRLTNTVSVKARPHIQGSTVVWTDFRNTASTIEDTRENLDIFMYDLMSGEEKQVSTNLGYQNFAKVYGEKIVYNDHRNGNYDVYIYDMASGKETRLTPDDSNQLIPYIWEDTVVWLDDRDSAYAGSRDYNIYSCDLALDSDEDTQPNYLDLDDDNDGYQDSAEIENNTDPLDPDDNPIPTTEGDNLKLAILIVVVIVILVLFIVLYIVITHTYTKMQQQKKAQELTGDDSDDDDYEEPRGSSGRKKQASYDDDEKPRRKRKGGSRKEKKDDG